MCPGDLYFILVFCKCSVTRPLTSHLSNIILPTPSLTFPFLLWLVKFSVSLFVFFICDHPLLPFSKEKLTFFYPLKSTSFAVNSWLLIMYPSQVPVLSYSPFPSLLYVFWSSSYDLFLRPINSEKFPGIQWSVSQQYLTVYITKKS